MENTYNELVVTLNKEADKFIDSIWSKIKDRPWPWYHPKQDLWVFDDCVLNRKGKIAVYGWIETDNDYGESIEIDRRYSVDYAKFMSEYLRETIISKWFVFRKEKCKEMNVEFKELELGETLR